MKKHHLYLLMLTLTIISCASNLQEANNLSKFPVLEGKYLGQIPPDTVAVLFAPGIISSGLYVRDIAMMPNGKEIYFCISALGYNLIFFTKEVNGIWTEPQLPNFIDKYQYMYYEPCISADGKKLFFLSNMPKDSGATENEDIWVVERQNDEWGKPYNLGEPICTENSEFYPSITNDGTLYFTRQIKGEPVNYIYRSKLVNGKYTEAERLPEQVNCGTNRFNAYIARDESFIVVPAVGMLNSLGGVDYYIVFRNADDTWQEPINMGSQINSKNGREWSFSISPDNKYLFFMSSRSIIDDLSKQKPDFEMLMNSYSRPGNGNSDIYWISSKVLENLKSMAIQNNH